MRTRRGQSSRGAKRTRIAHHNYHASFFNLPEELPHRKRLSGGSGADMMYITDPFVAFNISQFCNDSVSHTKDSFDALSDDIVISILAKVSASAACPADLINVLLVSKRFSVLGLNREVLANAAGKSLWVRAKNWSDSAQQFLLRCADAGNIEACHFLGMIQFYCLANHTSGIDLLKRAAQGSHAGALYSLAIIYFNGSGSQAGGLSCQCDPDSATTLCIRSAKLGNLDALREVAYCLQQGLGLPCSPIAAHRLLTRANTLELIKAKNICSHHESLSRKRLHKDISLLTNYGFYEKMGKEVTAANKFMVEWWWLVHGEDNGEDGLNLCSNILCGRRETRPNGFRRCSACSVTMYCSHACQEMHWKMEHSWTCVGQMELV
ncbi:hypothetical protein LUZ60_009529 [Juncus effusus]|nr:hypothetical protein LUZ60_009529 [Juncus effusus]